MSMPIRAATISRQTRETKIQVRLRLDASGRYDIQTGLGFLDHMLAHVAVHGLLNLEVSAEGDLYVDPHHTVEDVALALGSALDQALGERGGIVRVGSSFVPMDEALAFVAVDLSGRPYAILEAAWGGPTLGQMPTTLIPHFFESFAVTARANVHARVLYGEDDHHRAEALFKALGRALDQAVQFDPRRGMMVPSTKGKI